ncbi:DUF3048 domain-containing protein [Patescibacteria group bacterium]|nr:DUF3048 domain-containing protein [Patescibacteria group bacterium]
MTKKQSFLTRLKSDRKTQITVFVVCLLVVFLIVVVAYFVRRDSEETGKIDVEEKDTLGLISRHLDGVLVDVEHANPYPEAVMIENLKSVRPQSGLSEAGVVYEALAEGGITRFMAMYAGGTSDVIGPVRSARPYFVDLASEYNALYVHAGGSPESLLKIPGSDIYSINQIGGDHAYYWRDKSLKAPHNLFTKSELLEYALRDKNLLDKKPEYQTWTFEDEASLTARPEGEKEMTIPFSSEAYEVVYMYDRDKNVYKRFNGGNPHVDATTGEQLEAKNVIVQYAEKKVVDDEGRLEVEVIGEGDALYAKNGEVAQGTWKKENTNARTEFLDEDGNPVAFARGQLWIEIVPTDKEVIYN